LTQDFRRHSGSWLTASNDYLGADFACRPMQASLSVGSDQALRMKQQTLLTDLARDAHHET
jgi:hypothetical protein